MEPYRSHSSEALPDQPITKVTVCSRCGVVAPARGTACLVCGEALNQTRVEIRPDEGAVWVAVRCTFTCNSCKFAAPLDALDVDGAVECACCGLRQRFEVEAWREGLEFAHGVGDLAGPAPEGRHPHPSLWIGSENPYAQVGDTETFARNDGISSNNLAIDAAPGHPVCHACHVPLRTTTSSSGVTTDCPRCGDHAAYALPEPARPLSATFAGVVADEHRTDRPRARVTATQAGVEALMCPGCGAPLSITSGRRLQTCAFCKAACIVPTRSQAQRNQETPPPQVWWMLFQGSSRKRSELEAPTEDKIASAASAAINLIKPGGAKTPIGEAPGVYVAPEVSGIYWPQVGITLVLGSAALAVGLALYAAFAH
jgi:hypothetical protein